MCNIEKNEREEGKTRRRQERGTENIKERVSVEQARDRWKTEE